MHVCKSCHLLQCMCVSHVTYYMSSMLRRKRMGTLMLVACARHVSSLIATKRMHMHDMTHLCVQIPRAYL